MQELFTKFKYAIQTEGVRNTFVKCARYPYKRLRNRRFRKVLEHGTLSTVFIKIFEENYWNNSESVSGDGSTIYYTESLRRSLPELFSRLSIKVIFDAPCGDFNWMKHVIAETQVRYIGGDIVPALIEKLKKEYQSPAIDFFVLDITENEFPAADIWICRDCLFHLNYEHIFLSLKRFVSSTIPFILTTTYIVPDNFKNCDIHSGDFRLIDLFSEPFYFPKEVQFRISDCDAHSHFPCRELCLWTRDQIIQVLPKMEAALAR
jgi:SAM-dependent methyltransferase